jgi:hypothetical protein
VKEEAYREMDVRKLMQKKYDLKVSDVIARKAFERMEKEISDLNPDV